MMKSKHVDILIPSRYASSRFPGKPFAMIGGKPMLERVYEQARQSKLAHRVIIATDDERIANLVESFGGEYRMTRSDHHTGTDRLAEVAETLKDSDIFVNVQGDEPLISPDAIDAAIKPLLEDDSVEMSTIAYPVSDPKAYESPQLVKVVLDLNGFALYFSRHPIPFCRDNSNETARLGHAGLYVYRRDTLIRLASLRPTPLEEAEKLEQLRALENGIKIKVVVRPHRSPGVDVPEDLHAVEALLAAQNVAANIGV